MNKMQPQYDILVIDDEQDICDLLSGILEDEGYRVASVGSSEQAFAFLSENEGVKIAIVDVWLDKSENDGLKILEVIRQDEEGSDVLMMSGHSTIDIAVRAIKMGARDFITKPFRSDVLLHTVQRLLTERRLREENTNFRNREKRPIDVMLKGKSQVIRQLRDNLKKSLKASSNIHIEGDIGTGKSSLARYIHYQDKRASENLIVVNCSLDIGSVDFERIFGERINADVVESLKGGTLILEDVDTLTINHQKRLLQGMVYHQNQVDWGEQGRYRLITTSRNDLQSLVRNAIFDESLYFRLSVIKLSIPSLRNRLQDIHELIVELMKDRSVALSKSPRVLTQEAILILQSNDWNGNFYQLENVVDSLLLDSKEALPVESVELRSLMQDIALKSDESSDTSSQPIASLFDRDIKVAKEIFERLYLKYHLDNCGGNVSHLAKISGIERTSLHRKLRKLDVRCE